MAIKQPALGPGVYIIYCHENEKAYIGSSNKVNLRFNHHRCDLRANKHGNQHLQNAWNLYGESSFSMGVVQACVDGEQLALEQYYLDIWFESGMVFNRRADAKSPLGVKWTAEERAAKSIAMKANPPFKGRKHSDESKALLSAQAKERYSDPNNNPFYGKAHSEESKAKMSLANLGNKSSVGRICSDKCKAAVSASNKGRNLSTETRKKMSLANTGRTQSDETKAKRTATNALKPTRSDEHKALIASRISAAIKALPAKTQAQKDEISEKASNTRRKNRCLMTEDEINADRKSRSEAMKSACARMSPEKKAAIAELKSSSIRATLALRTNDDWNRIAATKKQAAALRSA